VRLRSWRSCPCYHACYAIGLATCVANEVKIS
jgi:hypothetical protein